MTIHGSVVGTHRDLEEVFELHRRGQTRVMRTECALDDVNEAIEEVLDGTAPQPRLVFDIQATHTEGLHDGRATAGVRSRRSPVPVGRPHDRMPVSSCGMRHGPRRPRRRSI